MDRQKKIVKTGIVGILVNILLVIIKGVIGLTTNSIAIVSDAINNLSDALSSVITIIGAALANRAPNKKHPFGYGRIEYMSALIVSVLVLYAGVTTLVQSVKKIIQPETPDFSFLSIVILIIAIIAKLLLGIYTKQNGKKLNSESLVASGKDSINDSFISLSVVITAFIFIFFKINIGAYVSTIISLFIIKSGIDLISNSLNDVLGERIDASLSKEIKATINENTDVYGSYDLILDNYGPNKYIGSIHIEVKDTMTAVEIDTLTRKIQKQIMGKYNVLLATVGIYAFNTTNKEAAQMYDVVKAKVFTHKEIIQFHGFYVDIKDKTMSFDIIIDFAYNNPKEIYNQIYKEISELYPKYTLTIGMDTDISD